MAITGPAITSMRSAVYTTNSVHSVLSTARPSCLQHEPEIAFGTLGWRDFCGAVDEV